MPGHFLHFLSIVDLLGVAARNWFQTDHFFSRPWIGWQELLFTLEIAQNILKTHLGFVGTSSRAVPLMRIGTSSSLMTMREVRLPIYSIGCRSHHLTVMLCS